MLNAEMKTSREGASSKSEILAFSLEPSEFAYHGLD